MSPPTAGHARRARRFPHILQSTWIAIGYGYYRISAAHRPFGGRCARLDMKRIDLYIKVELELDEEEKPERVAGEICRQLEKLHVVRRAEVSNAVARE